MPRLWWWSVSLRNLPVLRLAQSAKAIQPKQYSQSNTAKAIQPKQYSQSNTAKAIQQSNTAKAIQPKHLRIPARPPGPTSCNDLAEIGRWTNVHVLVPNVSKSVVT